MFNISQVHKCLSKSTCTSFLESNYFSWKELITGPVLLARVGSHYFPEKKVTIFSYIVADFVHASNTVAFGG